MACRAVLEPGVGFVAVGFVAFLQSWQGALADLPTLVALNSSLRVGSLEFAVALPPRGRRLAVGQEQSEICL